MTQRGHREQEGYVIYRAYPYFNGRIGIHLWSGGSFVDGNVDKARTYETTKAAEQEIRIMRARESGWRYKNLHFVSWAIFWEMVNSGGIVREGDSFYLKQQEV